MAPSARTRGARTRWDTYRGISVGKVIHCENGYVVGSVREHAAYDNSGKQIKAFQPATPELGKNFIDAVRSRPRRRSGGRRSRRAPLGRTGPPGQHLTPPGPDRPRARSRPADRGQQGIGGRLRAAQDPSLGQRDRSRQDAAHTGCECSPLIPKPSWFVGEFQRIGQPVGGPAISATLRGSAGRCKRGATGRSRYSRIK